MDITFYYSPFSSAVPVASALAELGVPHKQVKVDLAKQEQRQPDFLAINPNGKVPTLVVDGTPMFEALAIMKWLGDRFGVDQGLWPRGDNPAYLSAASWTTWAYATYCPVVHQLWLATSDSAPTELKNKAWANHAQNAAQELLKVLNGHLAKTGYIAGDRFSLADLIVSSMVMWGGMVGAPFADHPRINQWIDTCAKRPSIQQEWEA